MDEPRQLADALRSVARRELERTPGFSLGTVDEVSEDGLADVRAGDREHVMTGLGNVVAAGMTGGDSVVIMTGPTPMVLGQSPFYRGGR